MLAQRWDSVVPTSNVAAGQTPPFGPIISTRHPIPDYYRVTLEIARDRTTLASEVTCDGSDTCPEGYEEGDKFIKRTLNKDCVKHVSKTDSLEFVWQTRSTRGAGDVDFCT